MYINTSGIIVYCGEFKKAILSSTTQWYHIIKKCYKLNFYDWHLKIKIVMVCHRILSDIFLDMFTSILRNVMHCCVLNCLKKTSTRITKQIYVNGFSSPTIPNA